MRFHDVCIESLGYLLPPRAVSSAEIEARLAPCYERLGLPEGRLELMSGVRERRFWEPGTRPSEVAAEAGRRALEGGGIDPARIGCLIHASVCRDFLEPATANLVHHALGLGPETLLFDLSNACLGVLDGIVLVAGMIEQGRIEAGLVVSGECGEALVEHTIERLLVDETITRSSSKEQFASLTIGSAAAAVALVRADRSQSGHRLEGAALRCATQHHALCRGAGDPPLMQTRSEALLQAGCELAGETWRALLRGLEWEEVDRVFCHQVGSAHRRLLLETLALDPACDFTSYQTLGNTGSAALPVTLALGVEAGRLERGQRAALLGIGSGVNCLMLGVEW